MGIKNLHKLLKKCEGIMVEKHWLWEKNCN